MGNSSALGSTNGALTVNGGLLNINNFSVTNGNLTGTGGTICNNGNAARTLTIGAGNANGGIYQGVIADNTNSGTGTLALTKTGTGAITLTGANTFSGVTTVNAGKLFIHGDQTLAAGSVNVSSNATLGGTGTLGGDTTVIAALAKYDMTPKFLDSAGYTKFMTDALAVERTTLERVGLLKKD